jgi:flagellin
LENLGFRQGTFGATDNGLKINQVDIGTSQGASQALTAIDAAINSVSAAQAKSGAFNNRLDSVINNLSESSSNMQASRSRILDTDYASETTNLAKQQIIQQAATAMLAQANQSSQSILSLLK